MLFQSLVVVGPLGETLFFRGTLQERRGSPPASPATLHNVLLFLPAALGDSLLLALAGIFFLSILAGVYSYVRNQYGLTAAFLCQAAANLMLFVLPSLVAMFSSAPEVCGAKKRLG
jgi:membrane protease YdiL (CAAX protease family)